MLEVKKLGLAKSVGVSNFGLLQLEGLKAEGVEMPELNQVRQRCGSGIERGIIGTAPVQLQYCSSAAPILLQCCSNTASVLLQCCSSAASVLQYSPVLLQYCISAAPSHTLVLL